MFHDRYWDDWWKSYFDGYYGSIPLNPNHPGYKEAYEFGWKDFGRSVKDLPWSSKSSFDYLRFDNEDDLIR